MRFIGQNFGAGTCDRIRRSMQFAVGAVMVWGLGATTVLAVASSPLARLFNSEPEVVSVARAYLLMIPISYGFLGIAQVIGTSLNALNRPLKASGLVATRLMVLAVQLAWLGSTLGGLTGLFAGIVTANVLIGFVAIAVVYRQLAIVEDEVEARGIARAPLPV